MCEGCNNGLLHIFGWEHMLNKLQKIYTLAYFLFSWEMKLRGSKDPITNINLVGWSTGKKCINVRWILQQNKKAACFKTQGNI